MSGRKQAAKADAQANLLFPILPDGLPIVDFFVAVLRILTYTVVLPNVRTSDNYTAFHMIAPIYLSIF